MGAYKVKTYENLENDIVINCMIFCVLFGVSYFVILFTGSRTKVPHLL